MEKKLDLAIVIISFNTRQLTLECIESIFKYTERIDYKIVVVDNASKDGSAQALEDLAKKNKTLRVIKNRENLGFSAGNNQGAKAGSARYILFLNSDTKVKNNVIGEVVGWMDKNMEVGASGVKLVGGDGRVQESGGYFPTLVRVLSWMTIQDIPGVDFLIKPFHPLKGKAGINGTNFFRGFREIDWLIGACLMVRSVSFEKVGGWDESYFMYTEDVDICYKIKKAGFKIYYLPQWEITHYGGASSNSREFPLLSEFVGIKHFYKLHYPSWQYPVLRILLKVGALGRMVLFGVLEGKEAFKIYAKAFAQA